MTSFSRASRVEPVDRDRYRAEVPVGWEQGRGAFGGLVLGTMLRAMEHAPADPERAARVLTGDILAPVQPGPVELRVRRLREAKNQSNLAVEMCQSGEIVALATAVLSRARPRPDRPIAPAPPEARDWHDVPAIPIGPPVAPVFTQNYEFRTVSGLPFSSAAEPESAGFIRSKVAEPLDAAAIVALLDSHWPGVLAIAAAPRPVVTASFAAQILADPATIPVGAPLFQRARAVAERDGFVLELRELWHEGTLVGMNQQTFVIVK